MLCLRELQSCGKLKILSFASIGQKFGNIGLCGFCIIDGVLCVGHLSKILKISQTQWPNAAGICVMYLSVSLLPYQMSLVTNYIFKLMAVNLRESFSKNRAQKTKKPKLF